MSLNRIHCERDSGCIHASDGRQQRLGIKGRCGWETMRREDGELKEKIHRHHVEERPVQEIGKEGGARGRNLTRKEPDRAATLHISNLPFSTTTIDRTKRNCKDSICTLNAIRYINGTLSQTPRLIPQSMYPIKSLSYHFTSASPHAAYTASQAQSAAKPSPNPPPKNAIHPC